jgi:hypothetical protein
LQRFRNVLETRTAGSADRPSHRPIDDEASRNARAGRRFIVNKDQDQQDRRIQGQGSEPGKVWRESDQSKYTGYGDINVGGNDPGHGEPSHGKDAGIRGGFDETKTDEVNQEMDESQWQGNRFGQGGFGSGGSSNG